MPARLKPYTEIGIRRLKCFRCGAPAETQWNICADGNVYRPLCLQCDAGVNELVLRFMRDPDWKPKILRYRSAKGLP